jgi:hypothetical protein
MADADENQRGTADLQGLCEFSWSSLKHVEVMAWGSFTFCKSVVFFKRTTFPQIEKKDKTQNSFRMGETQRTAQANH